MNWTVLVFYGSLPLLMIGPIAGTYFPIRNAKTPAARRFLVKLSIVIWAYILGLVVLPLALAVHGVIPFTWSQYSGLGFLVLIFLIPWMNRRIAQLEQPTPSRT
jgi:hypothetical protein